MTCCLRAKTTTCNCWGIGTVYALWTGPSHQTSNTTTRCHAQATPTQLKSRCQLHRATSCAAHACAHVSQHTVTQTGYKREQQVQLRGVEGARETTLGVSSMRMLGGADMRIRVPHTTSSFTSTSLAHTSAVLAAEASTSVKHTLCTYQPVLHTLDSSSTTLLFLVCSQDNALR